MDDDESEDEGRKLEDVRMSNFAYSQTKISEYISFYFASLGVGSSIVASEIRFFYDLENVNKNHIVYMLTLANCSTIFLSKSFIAYLTITSSIYNRSVLAEDIMEEKQELLDKDGQLVQHWRLEITHL